MSETLRMHETASTATLCTNTQRALRVECVGVLRDLHTGLSMKRGRVALQDVLSFTTIHRNRNEEHISWPLCRGVLVIDVIFQIDPVCGHVARERGVFTAILYFLQVRCWWQPKLRDER